MNRNNFGILVAVALLLPACTPEPTATGESPVPPAAAVMSRGVSTNSGITTIDLGMLPGGDESAAWAVNQLGTIAGYSRDASGTAHLVRWRRGGTIEDLGRVAGQNTYGIAIDDAEEIVGAYGGSPFPYDRVYRITYAVAGERAFYWNGASGFQILPGQGPSRANGVQRTNNGTRTRIVGCDAGRVAVWLESGAGFVLSTPALPGGWHADSSCAYAVNPAGHYIGSISVPNGAGTTNYDYKPFSYLAGGTGFALLNYPIPGTYLNSAYGQSWTPRRIVGAANNLAVLWPSPTGVPIPLATNATVYNSSNAYGVNDRTEVVGNTRDDANPYKAEDGAFFWNSDIGLITLPTVAPQPVGWIPRSIAFSINDTAEVVGVSENAAGALTATLWLPHDTAQVIIVKQLPFDTTTHLPPKVSYLPSGFINDGILSRPGFDATQLDPNLITLGDGIGHVTAIARSATGAPKAVPQDVNGDGVLDLKVSFSKAQLIADGVLTRTSYQFEITYVEVTGLPVKAHYPIWVQ